MDYTGTIIEESLDKKDVLKEIKIIKTEVESVIEDHKTPWINKWTLHAVEIPENKAEKVAKKISESLDSKHGGSWYADFKNDTHHYIIFRNKVFFVDRFSQEQYAEAKRHGMSLGIPKPQIEPLSGS